MGDQVKILELAEKLIYLSGRNISHDGQSEGIEIQEIGLRPGEKLYEELLISEISLKLLMIRYFVRWKSIYQRGFDQSFR